MLKSIFIILTSCLFLLPFGAFSLAQELQTHDFRIIIEYPGMTFQEIADKEKELRKIFKDSEEISIEIKTQSTSPYIWGSSFQQNTGQRYLDADIIAK